MSADESPERYHDPEAWPYSYEILDLDWLFVDRNYQRAVTKVADQIAGDFDRDLLDAVLVSKRAKHRYAIIDGQNRVVGARRVGERWIWCRVLTGLAVAQEARRFVDLQEKRKQLTPLEKFVGEVAALDGQAVAISRFLKRHHVELSPVSGYMAAPDSLSAIGRVRREYAIHGEDGMHWIFDTIRASFPEERGRWQGEVIGAVAKFRERNPDAHQGRLVAALGSQIGSVKELLARSSAKRRGAGMGGGSVGYSVQVIEEAYRKVGRGTLRGEWDHP